MSIPLLIPPWIPPDKLDCVEPSALKISLCSDPFIFAPQNPLPNSKPFTAFIESIALPNSACNLLKIGSPKPTGMFCATQVIVPPIVSPAFLISLILEIIFSADASSGQRTILSSVLEKSKSW